MSAQRLLSCLLLLQGERRQTARRLAERLEVSQRTIYRDVEALSAAGVPIHMERGANGGIVLADDYRRALANFSGEELQALFVASASPIAELGLATTRLALDKLAGALGETQRRHAEASRDQILVDHNRWYRTGQPTAALPLLREAVAGERRVRFRYRDRSGAFSVRCVEPLGLVSKAGTWYLVARDGEKGTRTFRAERLASIEVTTERFERPRDFDLDAHWNATIASIERTNDVRYECTLRLRPHVVERIVQHWGGEVVAESIDGIHVRFSMHSEEFAAYLVVSLGDAVEILAPLALRIRVVEIARSVLAKHAVTEPLATALR